MAHRLAIIHERDQPTTSRHSLLHNEALTM